MRLVRLNRVNYLDAAGNARPAEVLLYRIQNGGHNWPGDTTGWPGFAVPVNYDISASNEIWNFFSRHEVAAIPEPSCLVLGMFVLSALQFLRSRTSVMVKRRTKSWFSRWLSHWTSTGVSSNSSPSAAATACRLDSFTSLPCSISRIVP
jgi:hypothetical protein